MSSIAQAVPTGRSLTPAAAPQRLIHSSRELHEVLCFRVGEEHYGVDILDVQEIRRFEAPTRLYGAPCHALGVLEIRGTIVPVVDGRTLLGVPAHTDASTVTIVFTIDGRNVGLVVDQVVDVRPVAQQDIRPAPFLGDAISPIAIAGLTTQDDGILLIVVEARAFLPSAG